MQLHTTQPIQSSAFLCTAMFLTSPMYHTNWMKVPCVYRFQSAAYICEKKATNSEPKTIATLTSVIGQSRLIHSQCPSSSRLFGDSCVWKVKFPQRQIDKCHVRDPNAIKENIKAISSEAAFLCQLENATVLASVDDKMLRDHFYIWREQVEGGGHGVLVNNCSSSQEGCKAQVVKYEFDHPSVANNILRRCV